MGLTTAKRTVGVSYKTPLNHFTATVQGYDVQARQGQFAKAGQQDVIFTFTNLVVKDTDEDYPYDALVLALKYADAANSGWVIFEDSILAAAGLTLEALEAAGLASPVDVIVGATVTMLKEKDHFFGKDKKGQEFKGDVWRVTAISGAKVAGAANAADVVKSLMLGKSKAEVHAAALADATIRKDTAILSSVVDGSFFARPDIAAEFKVENGVFVKA